MYKIFFTTLVLAANLSAATRTVGPEPGLDHGVLAPGQSYIQFGDIQRFPAGGNFFFGSTLSPNMIKMANTFLSAGRTATNPNGSSSSITLVPDSIVLQYNIRLGTGGVSGQRAITGFGGSSYGINFTDPTYQNWLTTTYFPTILLPAMSRVTGIQYSPINPAYISIDSWAQAQDYSWYGLTIPAVTGTWTNRGMTWDSGYPQTIADWDIGVKSFFTFIKNNAPNVRLSPHVGNMADWSKFQSTFADCPAMEFEWGSTSPTSSLATASLGRLDHIYNMMVNGAWFANQAAPVFPNDPPTRVVQWGVAIDDGDIHSGLANYAMSRGPNTFFDAFSDSTGHLAMDPSLWLPQANQLGRATSNPVSVIGSGATSLLKRTFENGIAYFNLHSGTQVIALPEGTIDWTGQSISSITLGNGKGDVVFTIPFPNRGLLPMNLPSGMVLWFLNDAAVKIG